VAPGNWTVASNWSTTPSPNYVTASAAPTFADDVVLESVSANSTVNAPGTNCLSLNASAYARTLTITSTVNVAGNVTFNSGMTVSGVGSLTISATSSLTTAGKTFSTLALNTSNSCTITLVDGVTCSTITLSPVSSTNVLTINNNSINVTGNITYAQTGTVTGTSVLNYIGTGTWNHTAGGYLQLNSNINTNGTLTLSNVLYGGATFSFLAGTISTTGTFTVTGSTTFRGPRTIFFNNFSLITANVVHTYSNFYVRGTLSLPSQSGLVSTLNTGTYSILFQNSSGALTGNFTIVNNNTFTFNNDATVVNATFGGAALPSTINGSNLYVTGNLVSSSGSGLVTGTTVIRIVGTGSWSSSSGALTNNLIIDTPGTLTIASFVNYAGSMTYSAGNVVTTGSTFRIGGSANLYTDTGTNKISFNNFDFPTNGFIITLGSDLTILGNFTNINTNTITSSNRNMYVGGSFTCGALTLTSTILVLNGSGTLQTTTFLSGTGELQINTTGAITLSTATSLILINIRFTWISGSVNTGGTTAIFNTNTITSGPIQWNNMTLAANGTNTLLSDMYVTNLTTSQQGFTTTINGFSIFVSGSLTTNGTTATTTGTTNIVLIGTGTVTNNLTAGTFRNNLEINTKGTITFSGNFRYFAGTLTYTSGNIISSGATLALTGSLSVIGFNKIDFETVTITAGSTITMDGFFSGRPGKLCTVQSTTTTNYIISFLDPFEKITQFVRMTNCTIASTSSVLLVTTDGAFTNITTTSANSRVRYINQNPNGVGKGLQVEPTRSIYLGGNSFGLTSDPAIN